MFSEGPSQIPCYTFPDFVIKILETQWSFASRSRFLMEVLYGYAPRRPQADARQMEGPSPPSPRSLKHSRSKSTCRVSGLISHILHPLLHSRDRVVCPQNATCSPLLPGKDVLKPSQSRLPLCEPPVTDTSPAS